MNQQYVTRRELNDPLKEMYGVSFNSKNKLESERILRDIHSATQHRSLDKSALCYIVNDGEIKGVGGSTILEDVKTGKLHSNLILNNFGLWLAVVNSGVAGLRSATLTDEGGSSRSHWIYNTNTQFNDNLSSRMVLQVGSGSTAPVRTDIAIETAFGTVPEMNSFESSVPTWNLTNSNFQNNGALTAGGAGTVNEAVLKYVWLDTAASFRIGTLYRDIISPGQVFIIGETIALEYTTQL